MEVPLRLWELLRISSSEEMKWLVWRNHLRQNI